MDHLPLRRRHYRKIDELVEEPGPELLDIIMQKKALATLFYDSIPGCPARKPSMVSSAHGAITEIMFTLPGYAFSGSNNPLWNIYKQLFASLPSAAHFTLVTHEHTTPELSQKINETGVASRASIVSLPSGVSFSVWAEDPFIPVMDEKGGEMLLVEPHSFHRRDDGLLSTYLGKEGWKRAQAPVYFEGGNTLAGDDFILMGADYAVQSLLHIGDFIGCNPGQSKADTISSLYSKYLDHEKRMIYTGSTIPVPSAGNSIFNHSGKLRKENYYRQNKKGTVQPLFHIDMFMTLAGRGEDGKYRVVVGDPSLAAKILGEIDLPYAMSEIFDNVAHGLEQIGFEVHRNPLPLTYVDDDEQLLRNWYFASANNSLVEITGNTRSIWMPAYGFGDWEHLKKTDEANGEVWSKLGFTVNMINDFHPLAEHSGALHCIKKVLKRRR